MASGARTGLWRDDVLLTAWPTASSRHALGVCQFPRLLFFAASILLLMSIDDAKAWRQDFSAPPLSQGQSTIYDPRLVNCQDLYRDASTRVFSNPGLDDFSQMFIDTPRQQLIVGARNHLLRLHLSDLTQLETVRYAPDNQTVSTCAAKGQSKADCHNYIRVLLVHKNQAFVCGTNAFAPQCSWRQVDNLEKVLKQFPGVAKCPYNPHHNATFIMTSDDNFYGATVTDFAARDPAIYRMMGPSKNLRTVQYNSRWLNEPDFVSAYEISEFVYFFFRETAVEYINCGKSIYSRVARVCKSDNGGKFLLEDNWTTFTKARLNCSLPGLYPFYFSELQSTYFELEQHLVYATFTTSPTSIYGSAVCVYNLTAFDQAFSGPFKYQSDPQMAWTRVPNNSPNMQCSGVHGKKSSLEMDQTPMQRLLVDAQKYQMMDVAVQPTTLHPFAVVENERFTQIVVDRVRVQSQSREVMVSVVFLATLEGSINKMVELPTHLQNRRRNLDDGENDDHNKDEHLAPPSCLVERIALPCDEIQSPILSLKLDREQKMLYVGTKDKVYRISVHRCGRFASKLQCVSSQDPYCEWSDSVGRCLPTGNRNLTSCPILSNPVDGAWCPWSSWQPCHQAGQSVEGGQCLCRTRSCDCPRPQFSGRPCSGKNVEVTNCTVHGGWTEWSSWSSCSVTCGSGIHSRQRTCSNPQPRFGGRFCSGDSEQSIKCVTAATCPPDYVYPAVDGHWSTWSEWSTCSVRCGGGHSTRVRNCNNPRPQNGGRGCIGNDRDWRPCNQGQCDEVRKLSDWSPWIRINSSREGYVTERFRCICKASISDQMQLRQPQIKTSLRYCSPTGDDCDTGHLDIPDIDGGWSSWSHWTECDTLCGSGVQHRERQCSNPTASGSGRECTGHSRELKACNTHSCQGQWSCWSDFGACSVTCGQGRKWRKRQCESEPPGEYYSLPCKGGDLQEVTCTMSTCDGFGDWVSWSVWSSCNDDNVQHRRRNCTTPQCQGADTESRICHGGDIGAVFVERVRPVGSENNSFHANHLLIVGVVSFLIGGAAFAVLAVFCWQYCQCPVWFPCGLKSSKDSAMQRCDVKQNNYFNPLQLKWTSNGMKPSEVDLEPTKCNFYPPPFTADCGCGAPVKAMVKFGERTDLPAKEDNSVYLTRYGVSTRANDKYESATLPSSKPRGHSTRSENNEKSSAVRDKHMNQRSNAGQHGTTWTPAEIKDTGKLALDAKRSAETGTSGLSTFTLEPGKMNSPTVYDNSYLAWPDGGRCFNYTTSLQRNKQRTSGRGQRVQPDDPNSPRYATLDRNGSRKMGSFSKDFDLRWPPQNSVGTNAEPRSPRSQRERPALAPKPRYPSPTRNGYGTLPFRRNDNPGPVASQLHRTNEEEETSSALSLPSWTNYSKLTVGQATLKRNALIGSSSIPRTRPN